MAPFGSYNSLPTYLLTYHVNKWLIFSTLFFFSCSKNQWSYTQYQASNKTQSFLSIGYTDNHHPDLSLEFIKNVKELQCFILIHRGTIAPYKGIQQISEIKMEINGKTTTHLALIFQGKEKLLLNQITTDKILSALKKNQMVTLWTTQSGIAITPAGFDSKKTDSKSIHKSFFLPCLIFEWPE